MFVFDQFMRWRNVPARLQQGPAERVAPVVHAVLQSSAHMEKNGTIEQYVTIYNQEMRSVPDTVTINAILERHDDEVLSSFTLRRLKQTFSAQLPATPVK